MAKRGGFPGMGGGNMANIMKQAQKMQRQMQEAQKEIEDMELTTSAGGGAVEVTINGKKEITSIKLSKEAVDPDDVEMLQDLIRAAVNEAIRELESKSPTKDGWLNRRIWRPRFLMENYGEKINELISEFEKLPGIGKRSAIRLAFHIINLKEQEVEKFANILVGTRKSIKRCSICNTITDKDICDVCSNPNRKKDVIMVVEHTKDMMAYERVGKFDGLYHVLNGVISPKRNMDPDDINLKSLIIRLQNPITEVIIATGATLEGETTAMYLHHLLRGSGIKTTRIASGVPVGGDLDTVDEVTLLRALNGRVDLNKDD